MLTLSARQSPNEVGKGAALKIWADRRMPEKPAKRLERNAQLSEAKQRAQPHGTAGREHSSQELTVGYRLRGSVILLKRVWFSEELVMVTS